MAKMMTNLRLSKSQAAVLCKVKTAATPTVAGEEATTGAKAVNATNQLVDLRLLIIHSNGSAEITPKGLQLMRDENLIDDATDELTDIGTDAAARELREMSLLKSVNTQLI